MPVTVSPQKTPLDTPLITIIILKFPDDTKRFIKIKGHRDKQQLQDDIDK